MKLVVLTGTQYFDKDIAKLLKEAGVVAYSRSDISGYKEVDTSQSISNWFASSRDYVESVMFFAFTPEEQARQVMTMVNAFNKKIENDSPVRAFLLCVDSHNLNDQIQ